MLRFFQLENLCVYREVGADGARSFPAQWRSCTTPCGRCFLVREKRLLARRCSCSPAYSDAPPRCSAAERGSGEGIGLLEKGLGCTLPESQQEGGLSVGAGGPQGASRWRDYPRRSARARSFAP